MAKAQDLTFKDLEVGKKAMAPVKRISEGTPSCAAEEEPGLVAETRKSARPIPNDIAEGGLRRSPRECRRFVPIALGSSGELHTPILTAGLLGYVPEKELHAVEEQIQEAGRMHRGLERPLA